MLRQAYANECNYFGRQAKGGVQNRPSEFFRNSDGSYFGGLIMNMQYIRVGDYFIPDLELPKESRPIGRWGRMHRDYLREHKSIQYNCLLLSGELWTYLADLNEQAQDRLERIIDQMKTAEGVTEELKAADPMAWVGAMNNIRASAEEIIREELIFV